MRVCVSVCRCVCVAVCLARARAPSLCKYIYEHPYFRTSHSRAHLHFSSTTRINAPPSSHTICPTLCTTIRPRTTTSPNGRFTSPPPPLHQRPYDLQLSNRANSNLNPTCASLPPPHPTHPHPPPLHSFPPTSPQAGGSYNSQCFQFEFSARRLPLGSRDFVRRDLVRSRRLACGASPWPPPLPRLPPYPHPTGRCLG